MRKLFATILLSYLTVFYAPFLVLGDETTETSDTTEADTQEAEDRLRAIEAPMMCPFGINNGHGIDLDTESFTDEQLEQVYSTFYNTVDAEYSDEFNTEEGKSRNTCGTPNHYSNYLEKGDCSADGLVVTELTEVIAPDVTLDEGDKIITVYAGLCCLAGEVKDGVIQTCDDTRTLYTTESSDGAGDGYTKCSAVAVDCEKRQWVIGSSGIGIIKLMVKQIFTFGAFAVGTVAVGTLVFQGIKISVSGVSGDISESKNKILQALAGLVLLFLSGLLLLTINPDFFQ